MLQVHTSNTGAMGVPQPTIWSDTRQGNRLDCETGALLRQVLSPVFKNANGWQDLRERLLAGGYDLRFEDGRLILIDALGGRKICSCRFLGHSLQSLSARFGKLRARPPRNSKPFGELAI